MEDLPSAEVQPRFIYTHTHTHTVYIPGRTVALVPECAVEDLPSAELQHTHTHTVYNPGRTAAMVPEFAVEDRSLGTTPC